MTFVNHSSRPEMLNTKMQTETKMPAASVSPAVSDLSRATAAMAFIGWTGNGIPKNAPVRNVVDTGEDQSRSQRELRAFGQRYHYG